MQVKNKLRVDLFQVGDLVRAACRIADEFGTYAELGDLGTVIHVDEGEYPTVRFKRTGEATIVCKEEIVVLAKGTSERLFPMRGAEA